MMPATAYLQKRQLYVQSPDKRVVRMPETTYALSATGSACR
jgi:hypothetical protein